MSSALRPWLFALLLPAACTQVLGIEDAYVDSSLLDSPRAGSGGGGSSAAGTGSTSLSGGGGVPDEPLATGGSSGNVSAGTSPVAGETSASGGAPDAPEPPSLCERYCDKVTANCKGKYEQYRSFDQCVEVCKRLPAGEEEDEDVNTVECRVRQADFAESEPFVYCKAAGPLGTGKCGSNCVSFCSLMQSACTEASTAGNLELSFFESSQACLAACGAIPTHDDDPTAYSSSASAEPSSFVGNTIYCRTYHLAAGIEQDAPDEHCPHAMGGDPCIEP